MLFRKLMKAIIPWLLAITLLTTAPAAAEEVIYWQNLHWPPFKILRGADAGQGRYDLLVRLFQENLPQYKHVDIEMNWARFWTDVKAGKHYLNAMAIKTEERVGYTEFSKVMTYALPLRVIMKKAAILKMGNPEKIGLAEFIRNPDYNGVIEVKRSYSKKIDRILNQAGADANFDRRPIEVERILTMLVYDRIDYMLEYPFVVNYMLKAGGLKTAASLGSLQIQELPLYVTGHVAAPKNAWGKAVIKDVNQVIDQLAATPRYLEIHKLWHSDERELEQIQTIHESLFRE